MPIMLVVGIVFWLFAPLVWSLEEICGVEYEKVRRLGQGSFGYVDHMIEIETGRSVAIKFVTIISETDVVFFKREVRAMENFIGNDHFVQLYDSCQDKPYSFIVMEYCNQGDLSFPYPGLVDLNQFWADFSHALALMKHFQIVHRDLKLENLFLHDGRLKIGDFGLARHLDQGKMLTSRTGTKWFLAPEVLKDNPTYDFAVDLWAAGIVLFNLATGNHPFQRPVSSFKDINQLLHQFLQNPNRFRPLHPDITQVVDALLQEQPLNRRIVPL